MNNSKYIIIVGCGRLGSSLANHLSLFGDSVVIIDTSETSFNKLSPNFSGFRIEGDATQLAVLKEAKTNRADILIACTDNDNMNLMVAQVAKSIFSVSMVMARVFEPERMDIFSNSGIELVCPSATAVQMFLSAYNEMKGNSEG